MQPVQHIHTAHVANKVYDVRHYTFVPLAQLLQSPAQHPSVNKGNTYGQKDGKEVHNAQHQQTVGPGKQAHVRKGEQYDGSDGRVVHGSEQTTEYAG